MWRTGLRSAGCTGFAAFADTLGISLVQCRPGDPEAKGLVERANGYLETSFLPGRIFTSSGDFTAQLQDWLYTKANRRQHRRLGCRPFDRVEADRAAMLTLPPVPPLTGWSTSTRLPRDHYVRLAGNDYSVHPAAVGRLVQVTADLTTVRVTCDGTVVAEHPRCWARHQSLTDPEHRRAAAQLRAAHRAAIAAAAAGRSTAAVPAVVTRPLSDYDALVPSIVEGATVKGGRVA